jgi:hypothetical protein
MSQLLRLNLDLKKVLVSERRRTYPGRSAKTRSWTRTRARLPLLPFGQIAFLSSFDQGTSLRMAEMAGLYLSVLMTSASSRFESFSGK